MTDGREGRREAPAAISFGEKLAGSETFKALFHEGMDLIEETASYLDGSGRSESRDLPRHLALTYATESMRLTTRLMQLASWLLLQRAVNEGEMTLEQANQEKHKVRVQSLTAETGDLAGMPDALLRLIERSLRLQGHVQRLDMLLYGGPVELALGENAVADQIARLRAAFGTDRD